MSYFEILELSDSKNFVTIHPIFLGKVHFKTTLSFIRFIFICQIDVLKLRLLKKISKLKDREFFLILELSYELIFGIYPPKSCTESTLKLFLAS